MVPWAQLCQLPADVITVACLRVAELVEWCTLTRPTQPTPVRHINTQQICIRWLCSCGIGGTDVLAQKLLDEQHISADILWGCGIACAPQVDKGLHAPHNMLHEVEALDEFDDLEL